MEEILTNSSSSILSSYLSIACLIVTLGALWMVFSKAGESGWKAIVPLYNAYTLYKLTWGNGWKFLLLLIPIANVVIHYITNIKLAKAFGKNGWFAAGLFFFAPVFMVILGFGSPVYNGIKTNNGAAEGIQATEG